MIRDYAMSWNKTMSVGIDVLGFVSLVHIAYAVYSLVSVLPLV